jgi:hypothetical protein
MFAIVEDEINMATGNFVSDKRLEIISDSKKQNLQKDIFAVVLFFR